MRSKAMSETLAEEEMEAREYDSRLAARLLLYLRPHAGLVLISLGILVMDSFLSIVGPYLTKVAIDEHIARGDVAGLTRVALIYLAALAAGALTQYLRAFLLQLTGQKAVFRLRIQILEKLLELPQSFYDRMAVGRLLSRAVQDVEVIQELFTQGVVVIFGDLVSLLAIAAALLWLDWRLALVTLCVAPPLALATALYRSKARDAYRQLRRKVAQLNGFLQESLNGMVTVQLFAKQQKNQETFDALNSQTREQHLRAIRYSSIFFPFVEVMAAAALGLILWYGGGRVVQEQMLPGVLVAFIQYMRRFFQPIRDLAEKYNLLQAAMASSERVFALLDTPSHVLSPENPRIPESPRGEIVVRDLWFSYMPQQWVLRGVSFTVPHGQALAIVGATGAGKSSLIGLFNRSYDPQAGEILVDGLEIRKWPLKALRRHVGVIPQEVFLFRGPLLENLRLWNKEISLEQIKDVARHMGLDDWIQSLPGGYQMEIQERGQNLSLGQRQLIAFLRAVLYDPRILVLDEATSSVDPSTELMLQRALGLLAQGRTCLLIAHRLSTVQEAHRILVLHRGRIVEQGTHGELLARAGLYQRLHRLHLEPGPLHSLDFQLQKPLGP